MRFALAGTRRRKSKSASPVRSPARTPPSARSSRTAPNRPSTTSTPAGGINGQKIKLEFGDDVSDPKQGVSVANKFVGDGVKFVVGHFNSGVTIPASEVYQENGILMITPAATNPQITERGLWNVFRTCGRDDQQGAVAGKYIPKHFKGKKIAIVHDKTTYGQGLADETKKAMNKGGMKEVLYEGINIGEKDFSALVSKIKAVRRRPRLLGRPAHRRRPDRAPDARPGPEGHADGRRRHHLRRIRLDRRPRRRRHADDLRARSAQATRPPRTSVAKFRAKKFEPEAYTLYSYAAVQVMAQAADAGQVARPARRSPRRCTRA